MSHCECCDESDKPGFVFAQGPLVRWLKVNFSETFIAWIHIKALRVYTESVLRYNDDVLLIHLIMHLVLVNIKYNSSSSSPQLWITSQLPGHAFAAQ